MYYTNGENIKIGDIIYLNSEKINGKISDIIYSDNKKQEWGVPEFGIMIECDEFGLLFLTDDLIYTIQKIVN